VLDFGKPLQAARATAIMVRHTKKKGFVAGFMAMACSFAVSLRRQDCKRLRFASHHFSRPT
jgi:hypothetical protein